MVQFQLRSQKGFILSAVLVTFAFLTLPSCVGVNHTPKSEIVMFQEKRFSDGRKVNTRYAHALASANMYIRNEADFLEFYPEYKNLGQGSKIGMHTIFMRGKRNSFSVFVGNGLGADFTIPVLGKLTPELYWTNSVSAWGGYQSILQNRILDGNPIGLSAGISYHFQNNYVYEVDRLEPCPGKAGVLYLTSCYNMFYSHVVGLRSVFTLSGSPRQGFDQRMMLYLVLSYNMDFTHLLHYPGVSISVTIH